MKGLVPLVSGCVRHEERAEERRSAMGRRAGEKVDGRSRLVRADFKDVGCPAVPGGNGADGRPHGAFDVHDETAEAATDQTVQRRQEDAGRLAAPVVPRTRQMWSRSASATVSPPSKRSSESWATAWVWMRVWSAWRARCGCGL